MQSAGVDLGRVAVLTRDLGDPVAIDHVRILTGPNGVAGSITIETSNDGEAWSYFGEPDSTAAGVWVNVARDSDVADPVTARFVRIVCVTTGADATLGSVAEVEILPPPASQNPERSQQPYRGYAGAGGGRALGLGIADETVYRHQAAS